MSGWSYLHGGRQSQHRARSMHGVQGLPVGVSRRCNSIGEETFSSGGRDHSQPDCTIDHIFDAQANGDGYRYFVAFGCSGKTARPRCHSSTEFSTTIDSEGRPPTRQRQPNAKKTRSSQTERLVMFFEEKQTLTQRGYKLTEQRQRILDVLKSGKGHMNAVDVHLALRSQKRQVSLATVYRTLSILTKLDLVRRVDVANMPSAFEYNSSPHENREHCHLVCENCGRIIDANLPASGDITEVESKLARKFKFSIYHCQLNFSGLCPDCQNS